MNIAHIILNHSLNLVLFFVVLKFVARFIRTDDPTGWQKRGAAIYAIITLGAAVLMFVAASRQFWFSYYFLIGLLPLINALFDFLSTGLTRFALRLGARSFGWRTLFYSTVDLITAVVLFVALVATAAGIAMGLNWATGVDAFPLQAEALTCLEESRSTLTGLAQSSVKGLANAQSACSSSIVAQVTSAPGDHLWLLLVFGSTLLPTVLHLCFALFAFGPVLLGHRVRQQVAGWARQAPDDPFMRGGAALFIGVWLSVVMTVVLVTGNMAGRLF